MKSITAITPLILACLAIATFAAEAERTTQIGRRDARPRAQRFAPPRAEWLDPIRQAPNGAQYQTFASKVLGQDVSYLVWLPPGYEQEKKRFPVIYWLHGMGGSPRGGAQTFLPHVEAAIKEGTLPPCIVVFVNGMVKSFYCDSSDGKIPMESVIIKDLIPHVDATYRTLAQREGRVIEGYSMGGYGAAHLGFKYPELFGTVVINAGALIDPDLPNMSKRGPMFAVFGDDVARRKAEHPFTLARQNADKLRGKMHIRIACGSLDGLLPRNRELHDLLTEMQIEHDYEIVHDVGHEAQLYYRKLGPKVYAFHAKSFGTLDKTK